MKWVKGRKEDTDGRSLGRGKGVDREGYWKDREGERSIQKRWKGIGKEGV